MNKEATATATTLTPAEKNARRKAYNQSYYERNKAKILARKKERYHSDPDYRDQVKKDSARRRRSNSNGAVKVTVLGQEVDAWRARVLADRVGRSVSTINYWQTHGTIPETPLLTPGGYRLYTDKMIEAVKEALAIVERPAKGDPFFLEAVKNGWRRAGLSV